MQVEKQKGPVVRSGKRSAKLLCANLQHDGGGNYTSPIGVPQGYIFRQFSKMNVRHREQLSTVGRRCGDHFGIPNVNIGTLQALDERSAPSAEKRRRVVVREAGSDSWKAYMRRQTNTIRLEPRSEVAQGVTFERKA